MRHPASGVSLVLALLSALSAQGAVVSPAGFANVPTRAYTRYPLGAAATSRTMRYMSIHDDLKGRILVLRSLALRPAARYATSAVGVTMEVRVSTAATLGAAAVTTYDANHGSDVRTVVSPNTPFSFPAGPAYAPVAPFVLVVPFTTAFVYTGSGGAGGIAWEMLIGSRTVATAFELDAASAGLQESFFSASYGTGCRATGRFAAATSTAKVIQPNVALGASNLTGLAPGAVVLGASPAAWGSLALPFDLPGTAGYPSDVCRVHCDWIAALPQSTDATGYLAVSLHVPQSVGVLGALVYHYAFSLDPAANLLGVVTTDARVNGFGDGQPVGGCRIYSYDDVNAVSGTKDSLILVTAFQT